MWHSMRQSMHSVHSTHLQRSLTQRHVRAPGALQQLVPVRAGPQHLTQRVTEADGIHVQAAVQAVRRGRRQPRLRLNGRES